MDTFEFSFFLHLNDPRGLFTCFHFIFILCFTVILCFLFCWYTLQLLFPAYMLLKSLLVLSALSSLRLQFYFTRIWQWGWYFVWFSCEDERKVKQQKRIKFIWSWIINKETKVNRNQTGIEKATGQTIAAFFLIWTCSVFELNQHCYQEKHLSAEVLRPLNPLRLLNPLKPLDLQNSALAQRSKAH